MAGEWTIAAGFLMPVSVGQPYIRHSAKPTSIAGGHHFMEIPIGDKLIAYALPG